MKSSKVSGLVVCGGKSIRMGKDKGLILLGDQTWAQHAFAKLSDLELSVKVSINPLQKETYINYFNGGDLILDDFPLDIGGPLLGLLSAHLKNPHEDLVVLACDMPQMKNRTLKKLMEAYREFSGFEAYVFNHDNCFEPLCAIYSSSALKRVYDLVVNTEIQKYSMKEVLHYLNIKVLKMEQEDIQAFENFNSYLPK